MGDKPKPITPYIYLTHMINQLENHINQICDYL